MTVKQLIEALQKFHPDAKCWAYEGEVSGVAVDEHGDTPGGFVHNDGTVDSWK